MKRPAAVPSCLGTFVGMGRFRHRCAVLVVSGFAAASVPAAAQFGGIFDPPRPPSNVPNRRQQIPEPPVDQQRVIDPQRSPAAAPSVAPSVAPSAAPSVAPIPSQSLPPPPGVPAEPAAAPPGSAPGQRPPRGTPQPANTAPQPGDEVITAPPAQKIVNPTAVFSGLDKITGRIT